MIIQSKETKGQPSLVDLLGGIVKNTEAKSDTPFSKLLTSLTGGSASGDFNALIDPKTGTSREARTLPKTQAAAPADLREGRFQPQSADPKDATPKEPQNLLAAKTDTQKEVRSLLQTPSTKTADAGTSAARADTSEELRNLLKSRKGETAEVRETPAQPKTPESRSEIRKELRTFPAVQPAAPEDLREAAVQPQSADAKTAGELRKNRKGETAEVRETPAQPKTPESRSEIRKELRTLPTVQAAAPEDLREAAVQPQSADAKTAGELRKNRKGETAEVRETPAQPKTPESRSEIRKELRTLPTAQAAAPADLREAAVQPQSADAKTAGELRNLLETPSAQTTDIKELQALLEGPEEQEDIRFISKELVEILPGDQVRTLIHQAKEYLKNEIGRQSPEYQNNPQSFPKTLIGLVRLADTLGLEPQSITLSSFVTEAEGSATPELLSKPLLDARVLATFQPPAQERDSAEAITQLLGEIKAKKEKNLPAAEVSGSKETEQPLKTLLRQSLSAKADTEMSVPPKAEDRLPQNISLSAGQPTKTEIQHPANANEEKKSAEEKPSLPLPAQQTAKTEGLIALLQGESGPSEGSGGERNTAAAETEPVRAHTVSAPDSLEVKAKEAQQSMRHFATDLKEAVENYKSPFTRLSMKLNPEKLGEVEVSLVQRGNNIHVNIQSGNASSIAFLAQNASELKAQLAHHGITNTTMNFMGGEHQHSSQGQQQQGSHNPFRPYESLAELELNEEQLNALELIIPHYA